jgi:hypothetical protein
VAQAAQDDLPTGEITEAVEVQATVTAIDTQPITLMRTARRRRA